MPDFNQIPDPAHYGPVLGELVAGADPMPLDAGTPHQAAEAKLADLSVESAFAHVSVVDHNMADCCLAGLWLLHNFLDQSHTISQGISTPSGSYWHGIMHRREGDYSNSKYWMRRVGLHPVFGELADSQPSGGWDPFLFVDDCQRAVARHDPSQTTKLVALQQLEWQSLFDFCYREAIAP